MFRKSADRPPAETPDRIDSVLGAGIAWQGALTGAGGVRIEGAFDGEIALRGLLVVAPQGRVTCKEIRAASVVVAGSVRGDITAQRVEITRSGRVWGDVVTTAFSTEEGAFLRGQIRMEEQLDLGLPPAAAASVEPEESAGAAPPES